MRKWLALTGSLVLLAGGAAVAWAIGETTGTVTACATSPAQTISANGVRIGTIAPKTACTTVTYTVPTQTVTVTEPASTTAPTTTLTTTTTPTTTAGSATGCFASPGSCGYPDPAYGNVGVPAGTTLRPSGGMNITTNGTVINGMDIAGGVVVNANNVTIENSRIHSGGGNACDGLVIQTPGHTGLVIKDSELSGEGHGTVYGSGVNTDSSTCGNLFHNDNPADSAHLLRVYMHLSPDPIEYSATVTDSYILADGYIYGSNHPADESHDEDVYNAWGSVVYDHDVMLNPQPQTAVFFFESHANPICKWDFQIKNSLLAGGGFMFYYCYQATSVDNTSAFVISNNRFARCTTGPFQDNYVKGNGLACSGTATVEGGDSHGYYPRGGYFGDFAMGSSSLSRHDICSAPGHTWSGNVWDDNSSPITC